MAIYDNQLHYTVTGTGRPLLLIHGWAMHRGVWCHVVRELADCCTTITVDLRGHGTARTLPGPYDFQTYADDITALCRQLRLGNVTALGWSMGGSVLLQLMQSSPGVISALVFISSTPCFVKRKDFHAGLPRAVVERLRRRIACAYPGALGMFHELLLTEKEYACMATTPDYELLVHPRFAPTAAAAGASLSCLADADFRPLLERINIPTLLIHGSNDRLCLPEAAALMHRCIPDARLVLLPDTGHVPFITRCADVVAAIRNFLGCLP
ncbi:MAG: alpha/beta hydrolase [Desulfobacterota bacterium]|nr:alpha/beta hydrolase [Thermodesulfobacteriota bacterium]